MQEHALECIDSGTFLTRGICFRSRAEGEEMSDSRVAPFRGAFGASLFLTSGRCHHIGIPVARPGLSGETIKQG